MKTSPIEPFSSRNCTLKRNQNFKGTITERGMNYIKQEYNDYKYTEAMDYINGASEGTVFDCKKNRLVCRTTLPDGDIVEFSDREYYSFNLFYCDFDNIRANLEFACLNSIEKAAKKGKLTSDFIQKIKNIQKNDEDFNSAIELEIDKYLQLNQAVNQKKAAFKTVYPILSALGLYRIFQNSKLVNKAIEKATKMIK